MLMIWNATIGQYDRLVRFSFLLPQAYFGKDPIYCIDTTIFKFCYVYSLKNIGNEWDI